MIKFPIIYCIVALTVFIAHIIVAKVMKDELTLRLLVLNVVLWPFVLLAYMIVGLIYLIMVSITKIENTTVPRFLKKNQK